MKDTRMKWYYKILGGHTHVRVFMNGKAGDLTFSNEEFLLIKDSTPNIQFIEEENPHYEHHGS